MTNIIIYNYTYDSRVVFIRCDISSPRTDGRTSSLSYQTYIPNSQDKETSCKFFVLGKPSNLSLRQQKSSSLHFQAVKGTLF